MKTKVHPKYYDNCQVICACGNTFTTGSTLPEIKIEICSNCHPFFSGKMKYVDTLGRVERFQQKQAAAAKNKYVKKSLRKKKTVKSNVKAKTLKEMLLKK